jgi:hypothetical protein
MRESRELSQQTMCFSLAMRFKQQCIHASIYHLIIIYLLHVYMVGIFCIFFGANLLLLYLYDEQHR